MIHALEIKGWGEYVYKYVFIFYGQKKLGERYIYKYISERSIEAATPGCERDFRAEQEKKKHLHSLAIIHLVLLEPENSTV